ncbi:hypothetical protein CEXT_644341 [Caerostris extrusa]|uniref:Prolactin receptor n=1 Tax=Caerostris extrusa TaxID=172846 RepID=A0AAV4UQD7_CAEEX|nr:hypothetical protein CEXT_644341 [Caerostris extrusa]
MSTSSGVTYIAKKHDARTWSEKDPNQKGPETSFPVCESEFKPNRNYCRPNWTTGKPLKSASPQFDDQILSSGLKLEAPYLQNPVDFLTESMRSSSTHYQCNLLMGD